MEVDLRGCVSNTRLPFSQCLMPLFEAVVNSIRAIDELGLQGSIQIRIERATAQQAFPTQEQSPPEIEGFVVRDNGIGFTDENFRSFSTIASRAKHHLGGKGVGRILWLKAFEQAVVESCFFEGSAFYRRTFNFRPTPHGVEEATLVPADAAGQTKPYTEVRLKGFEKRYREKAPKTAQGIARKVVEHCLLYFLNAKAPSIDLIDSFTNEVISLNELFQKDYKPKSSTATFMLKGLEFHIADVLIRRGTPDIEHQIVLSAHNRVVLTERLVRNIQHLPPFLSAEEDGTGGEPLVYFACLTGSYLDEHVDLNRTGFNIDHRSELPLANADGIVWEDIIEQVLGHAREYLSPYIHRTKEQCVERIRKFVEDKEPRYRPLLTHRLQAVETIPGNLSDERLELELHRIHNDWRLDIKQQANEQLKSEPSAEEFKAHKATFEQFFKQLQDVVKSDLAEYVIHRATVLLFLQKMLGAQEGGKFPKEDVLHNIFFPTRVSSNDISFDDHNLWLLDERLAYHRFLASDQAFKKHDDAPVLVDGDDRPDILIYNRTLAYASDTNSPSSVVIVEFKRPERDDYSNADNPIDQTTNYIAQISKGKVRRPDGSTLEQLPEATPFYVYIIATLTEKLSELALNKGFVRTPDRQGYFWYNPNRRAYIEIMSYRKLLEDAKKRNKSFFDKLQLPVR